MDQSVYFIMTAGMCGHDKMQRFGVTYFLTFLIYVQNTDQAVPTLASTKQHSRLIAIDQSYTWK